jgi:hypothetical protein
MGDIFNAFYAGRTSIDGSVVVLTDIDCRTPGIRREVHYQMTVATLIAAICANGAQSAFELPEQ